jgi:hypothetical protein
MPEKAMVMAAQLGQPEPAALSGPEVFTWGGLAAGRVAKSKPLFPRLED